MNNQWTPGPGNPQQWGMPPTVPVKQSNQGWVQGDSQWGGMQQASLAHQQLHQQYPTSQQPGYHGYPQGNPQYPPQQPMSQGAYIQEQLARAREEQRAREVELQKRKMMSINVAEAKPPPSIDSLIGLGDISPKPSKKQPALQKEPVTMATPQQPQSKARSWTVDTSDLQGVFRQDHHGDDDSFGEFQGPPPPLPQQPSGVGVVPTSSYTRPISSVSGSPRIGQRGRSTSSPHTSPAQPHRARSSAGVAQSAFPPLYTEVYNHCLRDGSLSTELLFPILMSSQLPKLKLGELWQRANRQTPGKLTQTELFVLLGFIGLVQAGNPSPKFADLQKLPAPPIPVLEVMKGKAPPTTPAVQPVVGPPADDFGSFQQGPSSLSQTVSKQTTIPSFATSNPTSKSSFGTTVPPVSLVPIQPIVQQTTTPSFAASNPASSLSFGTSLSSNLSLTTSPLISAPQSDLNDKYGGASPLISAPQSDLNDKYGGASPLISAPQSDLNDKYGGASPLISAPQSDLNDKYGGASPLISAPQSDLNDKYGGAFNDLQKSSNQPPTTGDKFVAFGDFSKSSDQAVSSSTPAGSDDFGSFTSVNLPSQPKSQFADFSSSSTSVEGWADFTVPLSATTTQPHTTLLLSGLDSLLPISSQSLPLVSAPSLLPTETVASTSSSKEAVMAGGTVSLEPRLEKKALTGLDILDEEMAARLLSNESSSQPVNNKPLVPESLDDFGEFEAFGGSQVNGVPSQESGVLNEKTTSDPCEVWRTCLVKCGEVLEKCVDVFESAEEAGLLVEIAESEEGRNKLRGIVEVYRLARRVYGSLRAVDPAVERADYCRAIKSHWSSLQTQLPSNAMTQLYSEPSSSSESRGETSDVLSDTISTCSLCQTGKCVDIPARNSLDEKREEYPLNLLFHNGQSYHASCANFWINVVQEQLPVLN